MTSLRKNTLIVNLKIHSAYNKFFTEKSYTLEAYTATDVLLYLKGIHPKFAKYMIQVESGTTEEGVSLLDGKLNQITDDMLDIKKFKDGDVIHLVPNISGGGGKRFRNALIFMAVVFAAMNGIPPGMLPGAGAGAGAGTGTAVQTGTTIQGAQVATQTAQAAKGLTMMQRIGIQIGLSLVSRLLTKSPAARASKQTESTVRDAGMFGSLTNSSTSGTPIALVYGLNRVGGQFLSGYISSIEHGQHQTISVGAQFDGI